MKVLHHTIQSIRKIPQVYADLLILAIIAGVTLWPLSGMLVSMRWDATNIYLPWKFYITECLKNGQLPLWNPYMEAGFPQMGDPGTWYPVSWIIGMLFRFYDFSALNLEYVLHVFIAGAGFLHLGRTIRLTRSGALMMSVAYMFSGFFISQAQHIGWIISAAWLPWTFSFTLRLARTPDLGKSLSLSLVLFLMISGGYPGISLLLAYTLPIVFLITWIKNNRQPWRKQLSALAIILLVPLSLCLISLPMLLSALELIPMLVRTEGLGTEGTLTQLFGSLSPAGLLSMLFPFALTSENLHFWQEDTTVLNTYFGILPLVLVIASLSHPEALRKNGGYLLAGLFFLLLSMATSFPLREWANNLLPGLSLFRFPATARIFTLLFFLMAAGVMADQIVQNHTIRMRFIIVLSVFAGLLLVTLPVLLPHVSFPAISMIPEGMPGFLGQGKIVDKIWVQGILLLILLGLAIFTMLDKRQRGSRLWMLGLLLVIDMGLSVRLNFYATVADPLPIKPGNEALRTMPAGFPIPSLTQPMQEVSDAAYHPLIPGSFRNTPLFFKMPSPEGYNPYELKAIRNARQSGAFEAAMQWPFAFVEQSTAAIDTLDSSSMLSIVSFSPHHIVFEAQLESAGQLVCLQTKHPRWKVSIDDQVTETGTAYGALMAVNIPAGNHKVNLDYHAGDINLAFLVAFIILVTLVFILIYLHFKELSKTEIRWKICGAGLSLTLLTALIMFQLQQRSRTKHAEDTYQIIKQHIREDSTLYKGSLIIENTDLAAAQEPESLNPPVHTLRIHHPNDVLHLIRVLMKYQEADYVLYRQHHVPILPQVRAILQQSFPFVFLDKQAGNAWYFYAGKHEDNPTSSWPVILRKNHHNILDSLGSLPSTALTAANPYSPSLAWGTKHLKGLSAEKLQISFNIQASPGADPGLVVQTEKGGVLQHWQREPLKHFIMGNDTMAPAVVIIDLRRIPKGADSLRMYFWNTSDPEVRFEKIRFDRLK